MAPYPLGPGQHHPPDTAVLLYRLLNADVETKQRTNAHINCASHQPALNHTHGDGGRADQDGDGDTNRHPVAPALAHAYATADCDRDADAHRYPISHHHTDHHAYGHSDIRTHADAGDIHPNSNHNAHRHHNAHTYTRTVQSY